MWEEMLTSHDQYFSLRWKNIKFNILNGEIGVSLGSNTNVAIFKKNMRTKKYRNKLYNYHSGIKQWKQSKNFGNSR